MGTLLLAGETGQASVSIWVALAGVIKNIWALFTDNILAFFKLVLSNENNYIMLISFALFFIVLSIKFLMRLVHGM